MKQFFKITFACILGVFIAGFLSTILFFVGIIIMASSTSPTYSPGKTSIYKLKMNTNVIERTQTTPMDELKFALTDETGPMGLNDILESIEKAKDNSYITGIYLNTDGYSGSYAITEAIRRKLNEFKESGKFIIAYNNHYTQNQYYLSTVADSIYLNPIGSINLTGLYTQNIFFKNALEKAGVQMQIFRVGTFKSAIEPFMLDKMSPANREQTETYLGSIWTTVLEGISETRGISTDSLNTLTNDGIAFMNGKEIIHTGLIDGLKYQSEMLPLLKEIAGDEDIATPDFSDIKSMKSKSKEQKDKVAVLYAVGDITDAKSDGIYWENTVKEIEELKKNKDVKAVAFRVNSPGGSAYASEQIWEAITSLKKEKPVVVSMSTYAASGGYYISCNADYIVAEPTTLTGSIGVFGMIPNASDLLTNKIGLTFDEVKTNQFGNISILQPLTETEKKFIQRDVEKVYTLFLERCAEGRNMPIDSIAKIAEGRVWSGENALQIGLVDALGGIDKAIEKAASLAELDKYSVSTYPIAKDFLETLMDELNEEATIRISQRILGDEFKHIQILKYIQSMSTIQARMEDVIVK